MTIKYRVSFFVLFLALAVVAFSHSVAAAPSTTEPGVILKGVEPVQRPIQGAMPELPAEQQEEAVSSQMKDIKPFILKQVLLDRPNLYSPAPIPDMYKDMEGKPVSFDDLRIIAQRMTKKYRDDDWIFSRAVLYPQRIIDGKVHLRAVEGFISHVYLVGNFKDRNGLIKKFASRIKTKVPANAKNIERYLLLINDLPGVTARSYVKPSGEPAGSDLYINIEEKMFEGSVSVDNRGSDYLGPYRGTLVGAFNNIFGLHDRTTLRGIMTSTASEMKFGDITHEEQIGHEGGKVTLRAAATGSNPGGRISSSDIEGKSYLYDVEGQYPLTRFRQYNTYLLAGFSHVNSTTDVLGIETAHDKVSTFRTGVRADWTDKYQGVNQAEVTATQGIKGLGANGDGLGRSRANGHHEALRGNLTVTRVQQLPSQFSLMMSGAGQIANNPLLASEEFAIGGPTFGRAYDSGELTGDNGYATVAELRYGGPLDSNRVLDSYQLYTFIDYGRVTNQEVSVSESKDDSLTSTGLGVRFNAKHDLSGYVEWDTPLTKKVESKDDKGSRWFFSLLKRF